jgi:4a-hydroxytetrahydrobiopterin dehydratase
MTDEAIKLNDFLAAEGAEDWRVVSDGAVCFYRTESLAMSANFVAALTDVAGLTDRNYGIDVRKEGVTVRIVTLREDLMGLTQLDLELARAIQVVGRGMGLQPDTTVIQSVLVIPGAPNRAEVMPFWRAVMGYVPRPDSPDEDLIDPHDRGIAFWFEEMEEARPGNLGAIHLAVWLPYEQAQARVDAALAAGGRLVRDDFAPAWWTLADAYGNEIDVATVKYRDEEPPAQGGE